MQIFWISGSVGKIKRVTLTLQTLVVFAASLAATLVLLGVGLRYLSEGKAAGHDQFQGGGEC